MYQTKTRWLPTVILSAFFFIFILCFSSASCLAKSPVPSASEQQRTLHLSCGETFFPSFPKPDRLSLCYSSEPSVVRVSSNGILYALSPGTARILYAVWGNYHSFTVTVTEEEDTPGVPYAKDKTEEVDFQIDSTLLFMKKGDSYKCQVTVSSGSSATAGLKWSSEQPDVAKVSQLGRITARKKGTAVIRCSNGSVTKEIYVNVITTDYDGKSCDFTMLTANGEKRTYRLYKQNAHNYPKYDRYLAWHGCATCSLATVLGGFHKAYEGISPSSVIDGPEKTVVNPEAWEKEHVIHSLKRQMPLTLYGISSILKHYSVENDYVRTFKKRDGREDILDHLRTGNPVIIEVRQKSNVTGEKSQRWTNSYHTMVLLGVLTDNRVLLCDSVDRSWYDEGERLKIISLDDVMEYMYSCTKFSDTMYFSGAASDGGYIKVYGKK
ncbi:MAG: Ig-like domain-containing protein [Eubacterium sp.]|nr:Ig-like domain-containing protein [Eubacterium sp.]